MKDDGRKMLHVYECRGRGPGWGNVSIPGYLGAWPEGDFCYLFFDRPVAAALGTWLRRFPGCILTGEHLLDYGQWQQVSVGATDIGPFRIQGHAEEEEDSHTMETGRSASRHLIRMEPGLAFGSGIHPTTRGCLLALASLFRRAPAATAVDLGTGTGILAIACARLGAARVLAIDRTPLAMGTANANVRANGLESNIHLVAASGLTALRGRFDLLVANIEPSILRQIMRPGDWLAFRTVILSGFLESRRKEVESILPGSFVPLEETGLEGWLTLTGRIGPDRSSA